MPLPPLQNGVFEVVLAGRDGGGNYAANVFKYLCNNVPVTPTDAFASALDLVNAFVPGPATAYQNMQGTDCLLNQLFARHIGSVGGAAAYNNIALIGAGTAVTFANVVAVDVAWLPGGATNKPGHTFIWGLPKDQLIDSYIQAAQLALIHTWATVMTTNLTGAVLGFTYELVTVTRKTAAITPVTDHNIRPKITGMNKRSKPFV